MLKLKSHAKINLMLEITGKEPIVGYHKLNTLMCVLEDCYDVLEIQKSDEFSVTTTGKYAFNGENILEKTANLFTKSFKGDINYSVNIEKNIKTGAGLGGGSSNAGTFLNFLLKENGISLTRKEYSDFAFKIGADVPFFYDEKAKICKSFGEELYDISFKTPKELYALFIFPEFSINTVSAYKLFKEEDISPKRNIVTFEEILLSKNSLTKCAGILEPKILDIISLLKSLPNVLKADMSGSGSACFALFESKINAEKAQKHLENNFECVISKVIF